MANDKFHAKFYRILKKIYFALSQNANEEVIRYIYKMFCKRCQSVF